MKEAYVLKTLSTSYKVTLNLIILSYYLGIIIQGEYYKKQLAQKSIENFKEKNHTGQ